jgi:hypothetical protein
VSGRNLALIALGIAFMTLLELRPISDVDLFWQVKLGQLMLERHALIHHDPFTFTALDQRVAPIEWLAQLVYALLHALGSFRLVQAFDSLLFCAGLVAAALSVRKEQASLLATGAAMVLACVVLIPHSSVRPQNFGVFALGLGLLLLERVKRPLLALAGGLPLLLLWQNAHPSVGIAACAFGSVALGRWWDFRRTQRAPWVPSALTLMAAGSVFAVPASLEQIAAALRVAKLARELRISEALPPWSPAVLGAMQTGWLALALSVLLLSSIRSRARADDVALFATMTAMFLFSARLALFWAVAMVPVWARWLELAWPMRSFSLFSERKFRANLALPALLAGVVLAGIAAPRLRRQVFAPDMPFEAAQRLKSVLAHGNVYDYREWGGVLIWYGFPNWKVAIDGRLYPFSDAEWRRYNRAADGKTSLAEIVSQQSVDAFFLHPRFHRKLIPILTADPGWQMIHSDPTSVVFVRRR